MAFPGLLVLLAVPFALGSFLVVDGVELVATGAFRAVVGVDTAMPIVKVAEIQKLDNIHASKINVLLKQCSDKMVPFHLAKDQVFSNANFA